MNRKKIEIFLGCITIFLAFFSWLSVKSAIVIPDSSTWGVPMMLFTMYAISICLSIILFRSALVLELVLFFSLLLSCIFAFHWIQFVAIFVGAYFLFLSSRNIREDMDLNVKINIWKSLQVGKSYLLIGICLVITAQYFFIMSNLKGEKKVPHLDVSFITKKVAIPFLASVNPQFKSLTDETLTVDQFILQSQNSTFSNLSISNENEIILEENIPANIAPTQRENLKIQAMENLRTAQEKLLEKNKELILENGRKQFGDQLGMKLTGQEKISDLLTGLMGNKFDEYFNPKVPGDSKSSIFSMILAGILFLTIYPLGSIMSMAWFLVVIVLVKILIKVRALSIKTITVSKESLE